MYPARGHTIHNERIQLTITKCINTTILYILRRQMQLDYKMIENN